MQRSRFLVTERKLSDGSPVFELWLERLTEGLLGENYKRLLICECWSQNAALDARDAMEKARKAAAL